VTWRPVDHAELLEVSDGDPYVEFAVRPDAFGVVGEHGWAAMHPWRPTGHWGGGAFVSPDAPGETESQALLALLEQAPQTPLEWFSTRPGRTLEVPAGLAVGGSGGWDFLTTREPAPIGAALPAGCALVELDDAVDAAQLEAFGRAHNADFEGFPGHGYGVLWLGLRDAGGTLVAIGGLHLLATGAPHLSGIVVDRAQRGRGLGRALTAELTRAAIDRSGVSTLGVYSANVAAIALYHSLGYVTHHSFQTRDLTRA
jgi:GNAT superfamily N-acetyltransferase